MLNTQQALLLIVALSAWFLSGCSTTLQLPDQTPTPNQEKVYLIKYGSWGHHSLAFQRDGVITEFTYGDWELFAKYNRNPLTYTTNITFFTQGALGRKQVKQKDGEYLCDKFAGCSVIVPFLAPADKVALLFERLEHAFESNLHTEIYNSAEDVHFVKYRHPYWLYNNCNHAIEDWLEYLGAEVSGRVFIGPDFIGGMHPRPEVLP